ncbi:Scavenger mRNA-decapping enzyme DcpS [Zootermopsis nevadensis]|uniref:m7GpppX diphosphatase n=2 Tax=Zootermopsis nevadensis TaxID=136037 RepID=A0A067R0E8_ZOONE|nr:Scavenger mRNA-decapping enzyme DcpS [Zootermopsis nevadensis]
MADGAKECEPASKKIKIQSDIQENDENIHTVLKDFSEFQQKRILSINSQRKTICIEGSFNNKSGTAIVLLEKKPFNEESLKNTLDYSCTLHKEFSNDIYGFYECFPSVKYNGIKTTVIHPATEKHIKKYQSQDVHLIEETPELYNSVTLPHLQKEKFSLQWVINILEHKSETDRVVFEDSNPEIGFILLPDLKWDAKQIEDLYLIAIVHQTGIKSLRDLNSCHLPLLKNIKEKGIKAIKEKYNIPSSQLRIYVHYQPSFYHLHVHFTYLKYVAPGIHAERSHILSSVIDNIELMHDYYQKATLSFVVKETETLFLEYEKRGIVKKR